MNTLEVYQKYLALGRHFSSDYDYQKYHGIVRVSAETFKKRNDHKMFSRVSKYRDPEQFLIGNFLFNSSTWIGDFNEDCRTTFESMKYNGPRNFTETCLPTLLPDFNSNFIVDNTHSIPHTLKLLHDGRITLFDVCVLEQVLSCDAKWKAKPQYLIFGQKSRFIRKAAPFFEIDIDKYKTALVQYFQ